MFRSIYYLKKNTNTFHTKSRHNWCISRERITFNKFQQNMTLIALVVNNETHILNNLTYACHNFKDLIFVKNILLHVYIIDSANNDENSFNIGLKSSVDKS